MGSVQRNDEADRNTNDPRVYKQEFVEFLVGAKALTFGDFVTKSGRPSPYFINTGMFRSGSQIAALGRFYAAALVDKFDGQFDLVFGPAYKGIPLAVATAIELAGHGLDVGYCFDRKEVKDHGEGGRIVGHQPADGDRVVIVEDIVTAGTAVRQTIPVIKDAADVGIVGLLVSVDRCEVGPDGEAAMKGLAAEFGFKTEAIVDVYDIIELAPIDVSQRTKIERHLSRYGYNQ